MNFQQVKKQLQHKRGLLAQVNSYRVMTAYCKIWKEKRSTEIQNEINQLLHLKAVREAT